MKKEDNDIYQKVLKFLGFKEWRLFCGVWSALSDDDKTIFAMDKDDRYVAIEKPFLAMLNKTAYFLKINVNDGHRIINNPFFGSNEAEIAIKLDLFG